MEQVPNFANVLTHNFQNDVLKTGSDSDGFKHQIKKLWNRYIEQFFHNDHKLWNRRKEPYIFYKQLFRQFLATKFEKNKTIIEIEQHLCGKKPHHSTIHEALQLNPNYFKLTQRELTEALTFLNKHYNVDLQSQIKTKIMKAKNMGYTTDDIARNFRVHEDVIHDILNNKSVSLHTLKLIESEL